MVKILLFDFARVFIFPKERGYKDELNKMYSSLEDSPHNSIWSFFYFDNDLLDYVKNTLKKKYRICMYTSGTMQKDIEIQEKIGGVFEKILSASEMGNSKSDKQSYLEIAKILSVEPSEILFIDDSQSNIDAAHHAGLVTHHYQNFENFKKSIELFS